MTIMSVAPLGEMFARLIRADGQGRAAKTVEMVGWLYLAEGMVTITAPRAIVWLLHLPPLGEQGEGYMRLAGMLVSGFGMVYVISGRLNADGFVFATLLDRPLVPIVVAILWYSNSIPATLALAFAVEDFGSFLWTLSAWRAQVQAAEAPG
jgi:hypothetical protein